MAELISLESAYRELGLSKDVAIALLGHNVETVDALCRLTETEPELEAFAEHIGVPATALRRARQQAVKAYGNPEPNFQFPAGASGLCCDDQSIVDRRTPFARRLLDACRRHVSDPRKSISLEEWSPGVFDQKTMGSCWNAAFSLAAAIVYNQATGKGIAFSVSYLWHVVKHYRLDPWPNSEGGNSRYSARALTEHGICLEEDYPYDPPIDPKQPPPEPAAHAALEFDHGLSEWAEIDAGNVEACIDCLDAMLEGFGGLKPRALVVNLRLLITWKNIGPDGGLVEATPSQLAQGTIGHHAVTLIGRHYVTRKIGNREVSVVRYEFQNSHGERFGNQGHFTCTRRALAQMFKGALTVYHRSEVERFQQAESESTPMPDTLKSPKVALYITMTLLACCFVMLNHLPPPNEQLAPAPAQAIVRQRQLAVTPPSENTAKITTQQVQQTQHTQAIPVLRSPTWPSSPKTTPQPKDWAALRRRFLRISASNQATVGHKTQPIAIPIASITEHRHAGKPPVEQYQLMIALAERLEANTACSRNRLLASRFANEVVRMIDTEPTNPESGQIAIGPLVQP